MADNTAPYKPPRAPSGLDTRGGALWRSVVSEYLLREDELQALAAACRLADEIGRMEVELRDQPVVVPGSKGQNRPNPLLMELRNHRLAFNRILVSLQLPDDPAESRGTERSHRGRALAAMRWGRRGG